MKDKIIAAQEEIISDLEEKNRNLTIELRGASCCTPKYTLFVTQYKGTFDEVRKECLLQGADLIDWKTWGFGPVGSEYFCDIRTFQKEHINLWIGISDRLVEGEWLWLDDTPYRPNLNVNQVYNWASGHPQDLTNHDKSGEDCAQIGNSNAIWDYHCSYAGFKGLCQKPMNS